MLSLSIALGKSPAHGLQLPTSHYFRRRSAKKGRKGMKENGHLYRNEEGISEVGYPDYNYPFYDNGRLGGFTGKPAVMYMNPAADPEVREFYAMDRSTAPPSRYSSWVSGSRKCVATGIKAVHGLWVEVAGLRRGESTPVYSYRLDVFCMPKFSPYKKSENKKII